MDRDFVKLVLVTVMSEEPISVKVVSDFPVSLPSSKQCVPWSQADLDNCIAIILISPRSGNVSYLVSVVKTPDLIRKFSFDSFPGILCFKSIVGTELYSTEFSFEFRTNILDFVKLSNSNISPVRDFNFTDNLREVDLWLIVDSMDSMANIVKGFQITVPEGH